MLDWHLEWYNKKENDPEKWAKGKNPAICQQKLSDGSYGWRLTTEKRKEILLNNIYGVDIDRQAVEVTKLNLLLKVLEQENTQDLFSRMERALPDLGANIKCGNSLIGSDFYDNRATLFDMEESYRVNAFDWDREFPKIIRWKTFPGNGKTALPSSGETIKDVPDLPSPSGGLLAPGKGAADLPSPSGGRRRKVADEGVLKSYGTTSKQPPHPDPLLKGEGVLAASGGERELEDGYGFDAVIGNPPYGASFDKTNKVYLSNNYNHVADYESSQYFILRSCEILKTNGYFGMIIQNTVFLNLYAKNFRLFLLGKYEINKVVNLSDLNVFQDATVRTAILVIINRLTQKPIEFINMDNQFNHVSSVELENKTLLLDDNLWSKSFSKEIKYDILKSISKITIKLSDILEVSQGLIPYDKYKGHDENTIKNRIWHSNVKKDESYRKELKGGDVTRYNITWNGKNWISYGKWLAAPRKKEYFVLPRILFREITDTNSKRIYVAYSSEELYNNPSIINCIKRNNPYSLFYILGIVNSKLISFYHYKNSPKASKGVFPKILVNDVRGLPIFEIDFDNKKDVECHDKMVKLVEQMLDLNKKLRASSTPDEKAHLERAIGATDCQIDQLVYELYDLTQEEIAIIEEQSK